MVGGRFSDTHKKSLLNKHLLEENVFTCIFTNVRMLFQDFYWTGFLFQANIELAVLMCTTEISLFKMTVIFFYLGCFQTSTSERNVETSYYHVYLNKYYYKKVEFNYEMYQ